MVGSALFRWMDRALLRDDDPFIRKVGELISALTQIEITAPSMKMPRTFRNLNSEIRNRFSLFR